MLIKSFPDSEHTEEYIVTFWHRIEDHPVGFWKQKSLSVFAQTKTAHQDAEDFIRHKYNIQKHDIVSVKYQ